MKWYVVWYSNPAISQRLQVQSYNIIHTSDPPAVGSTYKGNIVTTVQGPYATEQAAQDAIGSNTSSGVGEGAGTGVASRNVGVPDIIHGFNIGSLAIRIAEVLLGVVLVGVGLAKLTGTENIVSKAVPVATKFIK